MLPGFSNSFKWWGTPPRWGDGKFGWGLSGGGNLSRTNLAILPSRQNPGYSHIFKMPLYKAAIAILFVIRITFCMRK